MRYFLGCCGKVLFLLSMHVALATQNIKKAEDELKTAIRSYNQQEFEDALCKWRRLGGKHNDPLFLICGLYDTRTVGMMHSFLKASNNDVGVSAINLNWRATDGESALVKTVLSLPKDCNDIERKAMLSKVRLLLKYGVKTIWRDKQGYTVLDYAYGEVNNLQAKDGRKCPLIYELYEMLIEKRILEQK